MGVFRAVGSTCQLAKGEISWLKKDVEGVKLRLVGQNL